MPPVMVFQTVMTRKPAVSLYLSVVWTNCGELPGVPDVWIGIAVARGAGDEIVVRVEVVA